MVSSRIAGAAQYRLIYRSLPGIQDHWWFDFAEDLFAEVTPVGGKRSNVFRDARVIKIGNRLIGHRDGLPNIVRLISDISSDDNLLIVGHSLSISIPLARKPPEMELTNSFDALLRLFAPVFTEPSFLTFRLMMTGWILSVRHRYVTDLIISNDAVGYGHFSDYHRFFSQAV